MHCTQREKLERKSLEFLTHKQEHLTAITGQGNTGSFYNQRIYIYIYQESL